MPEAARREFDELDEIWLIFAFVRWTVAVYTLNTTSDFCFTFCSHFVYVREIYSHFDAGRVAFRRIYFIFFVRLIYISFFSVNVRVSVP